MCAPGGTREIVALLCGLGVQVCLCLLGDLEGVDVLVCLGHYGLVCMNLIGEKGFRLLELNTVCDWKLWVS